MTKSWPSTFAIWRAFCFTAVFLATFTRKAHCADELHPVNLALTSDDEYLIRSNILCRGFPCPNFTLVKDVTSHLQQRHYGGEDIVVATDNNCNNFTYAVSQAYPLLYRYRKGSNAKGIEMPMSVPLVVEVTPQEVNDCNARYAIWMFVNVFHNVTVDLQQAQPTETGVKVKRLDALDVYVRTFTGDIVNQTDIQLDRLQSDLKNAKLCFKTPQYMIAMYDPPWKKGGRRTEIWLEKESC